VSRQRGRRDDHAAEVITLSMAGREQATERVPPNHIFHTEISGIGVISRHASGWRCSL
jgi:hypothetical protein